MNQILNNFNSKKNIKSAIGIMPVNSNIKNSPQNYNNNNTNNKNRNNNNNNSNNNNNRDNNNNNSNNNNNNNNRDNNNNNNLNNTFIQSFPKISKYKIQFLISVIVLFIAISLLISNIYSYNQKENVSKNLLNAISVTKLYSNNQDYTTPNIEENNSNVLNLSDSTEMSANNTKDPFVIGIIQINKINVNYPILSKTTKELLKVSLCRCAGPMPNQVGNLCIAGHNLVDYKLFSRLNEINLKDIIKIYDLNGNMKEYEVCKKYEVIPTNLSCLSQNTNGKKIVTLLTCNNVNGKRLIVVAKEI